MMELTEAEAMLSGFTGKMLVKYYNELAEKCGEKPTKRFMNLGAGKKRVLRLMALCRLIPETKAVLVKRKPRKKVFRYPPNGRNDDGIPAIPTPDTLRWRVQMALMSGATLGEIAQIVEDHDVMTGVRPYNIERRAYNLVRAQHTIYGWGLRETAQDDGVSMICIFSKFPPKQIMRGSAYAA